MLSYVIWGASGHALVVEDILRLRGGYVLEGYIDSVNASRKGEAFGGATILGTEEVLPQLLDRGVDALALGVGDCQARLQLAEEALALGFTLLTAVHPAAVVAESAVLGAGSILCAGSVVNPAATLGRAVIINTSASVDHHCNIGDGAHLAPGVHLAGNVTVGNCVLLGIGSCVRDNVTIADGCIIGAGSVVVGDLSAHVTAYGVPARPVATKT